jgi:hypothetical protein
MTSVPSIPDRPPSAKPRRWLQYRLGSLIVVMLLCALGLTWWRQWKHRDDLAAARRERDEANERVAMLQARTQHLEAIDSIYRALDVEIPEHREVFEVLHRLPGWSLAPVVQRRVDDAGRTSVGLPMGRLEVLLIDNAVTSNHSTVAVILKGGAIVDVLRHTNDSLRVPHSATLADPDRDGVLDLVFFCLPGKANSEPYTLSHSATAAGFGPEVRRSGAPLATVGN